LPDASGLHLAAAGHRLPSRFNGRDLTSGSLSSYPRKTLADVWAMGLDHHRRRRRIFIGRSPHGPSGANQPGYGRGMKTMPSSPRPSVVYLFPQRSVGRHRPRIPRRLEDIAAAAARRLIDDAPMMMTPWIQETPPGGASSAATVRPPRSRRIRHLTLIEGGMAAGDGDEPLNERRSS
jgi:hypothetical protein